MSWLELIDNTHFLRSLFPQGAPSLGLIEMHEVQLRRDGPVVIVRFDLTDYPANPPAKWQEAGHNTLQVTVMGVGVRQLAVAGWVANNVGTLSFSPASDGVEMSFDGEGVSIRAHLDHVRVEGVSGYQK